MCFISYIYFTILWEFTQYILHDQLHWCLDVIFREDAARAKKDNSPLNMNILRKLALTLVNEAKFGRLSKKKMMFKAALNPAVLLSILFPKK